MIDVSLHDFPLQSTDKVRYADTDRQGHINNSVFCQYLETARAELLYSYSPPLLQKGTEFVIADLSLSFKGEIQWPGHVHVGTSVAAIGNSSIRLDQVIFQNDRCAAAARSVIVCIDSVTRRPRPLPPATVSILQSFASGVDADAI